MTLNLLILGGTTEARHIAERLAGDPRFHAELSLAGRTADPLPQSLDTRIGGFGGAKGLADYITHQRIGGLLVATHPFAAEIAANAAAAAQATGIPALRWLRRSWSPEPGDRWEFFPTLEALADAIGLTARRVFVTTGRQRAQVFERAPQHAYLFRSIEPIEPRPVLADAQYILARGPFGIDGEIELMRRHGTELLVAKMSGGAATHAKIEAARILGIPVYLLARPDVAGLEQAETLDEVLAWLDQLALRTDRGE